MAQELLHEEGTAFYHHWVVSYPVAVVDFTLENPLRDLDVGYDDQLNTCPEENDDQDDATDIFLPDEGTTEELRVNVEDPAVFNQMGEEMTDESQPKQKRKGKFKRFFGRMFKKN